MSSSELQIRWQSKDYKNYLKVIEALLYLRDGLGPFSQRIISDFQSEILASHKITPKECTTKTCNWKNIKNRKLQHECADICSVFLMEILKACKNPGFVYWENSKICRWSVDAWEIAKVYMGRGQKAHNNGPQKSDSAAILQLLTNCKRYGKYAPCGHVDKVLTKRNEAMHSSTLSFSNDEMQDALSLMMDFLKTILNNLSAVKDIESRKEIEKTINILKELMSMEFEIFLKNNEKSPHDEEMKILQEIINDHENRLNSLEELTEKVKEIKEVIPFLEMMQRNPDLMAGLEDGYRNLISLSQLEEKTSALTEITEATASRVADVEEDLADLRNQVEALSLKSDKSRSQATNHKGQLKNFLDSKRISVPPKYMQQPDPTSNHKWLASVTVILDSETKTFKSPDSCKRIIDAEHSAASEAYQFLRQHEELFSDLPVSDKGEDPKEELDKMLKSFGFAKATYNDCGDKFTGKVKNFTASVAVNVTGIIQKKLDDVNMKQSDREQAVALDALKAIGQAISETAKNTLYGWCGRNGFTHPKYYPDSPVESSYIYVMSSAFSEKQKLEVEGSWHPSKKEAKQSAAESLLKIIKETKLTGIWSSSCQPTGDSPSTVAMKASQSSDTPCNNTKAEAKASENITAMLITSDSSFYCAELRSLCEKLDLVPPEYKVVPTTENRFQPNLTMQFVFGPEDDKQFKNKAEAENEAARIALAVLRAGTTLDLEGKKFKSLLNEVCQKEGIKNNTPDYDTKVSGTSFHSKVKVKFVESHSEAFQTESEARNFLAKKVLLKLGHSKNHFEILQKSCAESGLEAPKVEYKSRPDGVEGFRAVLDGMCSFALEIPFQNKKDAEKNVACHALKVLYPNVDCSDLNKCKNLLQEKTPSNPPKYDPEKLQNGQFLGKVTVWFSLEGSSWHCNKEDALNEVAKEFLVRSTSSSG